MTTDRTPHVVEATRRLDGSVIITFDDGKCATYPAALLYAAYANAQQIPADLSLPIPE